MNQRQHDSSYQPLTMDSSPQLPSGTNYTTSTIVPRSITDALPVEPYHRVPEAFTVLAGCQQSAELPSLEMLDIRKLKARGSNLMRYQVCITTDTVPTTAFLPYQLRRASGLDGNNVNQRQQDSWVEHNPAYDVIIWPQMTFPGVTYAKLHRGHQQ